MNTLIFSIPENYLPEVKYILKVIIQEFLGLDYVIDISNDPVIKIKIKGDDSDKVLVIENILFNMPSDNWLKKSSLPISPLSSWDVLEDLPEVKLCENSIPIIYGKNLSNGKYLKQDENSIHLGLDVFGSCFFMLTRYEEIVVEERDIHERFTTKASLAYKEKFLTRPIVNEYIEILWTTIKRLWPRLERKEYTYKVLLTHDVDHPFVVYDQDWHQILRNIAGDVINRKDIRLAVQRIRCKIKDDPNLDPANTFDFIMNLSEKYGLNSEFYFITEPTAGPLDGSGYSIENPQICSLMKRIYQRGHRIGLHASYNSFKSPNKTRREFERLIHIAEKLGIKQDSWGGRQHYLRWENPVTWQNWEDAGINYDTTLSFADYVGFRTGTCYEYPVYNLLTRKELKLKEKPLIVMDGTLFGNNYMSLKMEEAIRYIEYLSKCCRLFGGNFVLLWHNSSFMQVWEKNFYQEIIKLCILR